jgi:RNA polymerase sigma-70 factor (ECF subfamily)
MLENDSIETEQVDLLRRIAGQDRVALAEYYDHTAPALFSFARQMLGNASDAEEVIQDVFVQIWNKAATFDPNIGRAFHWSMSITRHRCIDWLRARQRRSRVLVAAAEGLEGVSDVEPARQESAMNSDEVVAIRSAVVGLPREQRQAIEMAFFGGLTHEEIAEALNEPLGTVKARIRRGMLKLRDNLKSRL